MLLAVALGAFLFIGTHVIGRILSNLALDPSTPPAVIVLGYLIGVPLLVVLLWMTGTGALQLLAIVNGGK